MRSVFTLATVLALSWQASVSFGQASFTTPVVADVVKLSQAKVDEGTIVAFVQSSTGANLSASEIIDLRSQGVSDRVVVALLNQLRPGAICPSIGTSCLCASGAFRDVCAGDSVCGLRRLPVL
jgi:hypothetical protein